MDLIVEISKFWLLLNATKAHRSINCSRQEISVCDRIFDCIYKAINFTRCDAEYLEYFWPRLENVVWLPLNADVEWCFGLKSSSKSTKHIKWSYLAGHKNSTENSNSIMFFRDIKNNEWIKNILQPTSVNISVVNKDVERLGVSTS